ncbi:MAG: hypothetical protein ACE5E5_15500 [Phycisphaerae bacterium]
MAPTREAVEVLDREFLEIRHRLLDVAAWLDRIDAAADPQHARADARMEQVDRAVSILSDSQADKARRVQLAFSLEYDANWRMPS